MKILHIYPKDDNMIAQYASMIAQGMPAGVESITTNSPIEAKQQLADFKPDIVHLHGCLDTNELKVIEKARKDGARLVITCHGQLQPWEQEKRKPSLHNGLIETCVSHAFALIAQSDIEAKNLNELEWNDRIETIKNPIITRSTTTELMVRATLAVYEKVMHSDVLELMDETDLNALHLLIKAGITGDKRWIRGAQIGSPNWQRLYIYAKYEGIELILRRGIVSLGIEPPQPNLTAIYLPNDFHKPQPSADHGILPLIRKIKKEVDDEQLSFLRLVELDEALRSAALDEEVLMAEIQGAKLLPFLQSLLQVLSEHTLLDRGYMPCEPTDNPLTRKIKVTLSKHLKI